MIIFIIGDICRENKVFFHTDAAQVKKNLILFPKMWNLIHYLLLQAIGKIPINVNEMKIDLMSISGHKVYGPKGDHAH